MVSSEIVAGVLTSDVIVKTVLVSASQRAENVLDLAHRSHTISRKDQKLPNWMSWVQSGPVEVLDLRQACRGISP